jgi:hypothetical protein
LTDAITASTSSSAPSPNIEWVSAFSFWFEFGFVAAFVWSDLSFSVVVKLTANGDRSAGGGVAAALTK